MPRYLVSIAELGVVGGGVSESMFEPNPADAWLAGKSVIVFFCLPPLSKIPVASVVWGPIWADFPAVPAAVVRAAGRVRRALKDVERIYNTNLKPNKKQR